MSREHISSFLASEQQDKQLPRRPEIVLSQETEPITNSLLDMRDRDRNIAEYVPSCTLFGGKDIVVVNGEPGTAKSTVVEELKRNIERNADHHGKKVKVVKHFYDNHLDVFERNYGPREGWSIDKEWVDLNVSIYESVREYKSSESDSQYEKIIHLLEMPGVGKTDKRNRGVLGQKMLLDEASRRNDTLFIFMGVNRLVQRKAGFIRSGVMDIPDVKVPRWLEKRGVILEGPLNDKEKGESIKRIYKKAANPIHIETIRREEQAKIDEWKHNLNFEMINSTFEDDPNSTREANVYDISLMRRRGINMPPNITTRDVKSLYESFGAPMNEGFARLFVEDFLEQTLDQAIYYEELFKTQYSLPKSDYIIAFNPYTPKPLTIYFNRAA